MTQAFADADSGSPPQASELQNKPLPAVKDKPKAPAPSHPKAKKTAAAKKAAIKKKKTLTK